MDPIINGQHVDKYGTQRWYNDGKLHRDNDLPAIIRVEYQEWYKNGQKHRDGDLPSKIWACGDQQWYKNGKMHRDNDSPTIICIGDSYTIGYQRWCKDGQKHRDDGPAIIYDDGKMTWYRYGHKYVPKMKKL